MYPFNWFSIVSYKLEAPAICDSIDSPYPKSFLVLSINPNKPLAVDFLDLAWGLKLDSFSAIFNKILFFI